MNTQLIPLAVTLAAYQGTEGIKGLLITFIVLVLIIAAIAGLIWCIERWINPIPSPGKMIIAIVLVVLVILWAVNNFL